MIVQVPALTTNAPTDPGYQRRCIENDARRAALMSEAPDKVCAYVRGSLQWGWWHDAYAAQLLAMKVAA